VRLHREESGYTLIETMISIFVLALVLTFVYQVMMSVQKNTVNANQRLENLEEARVLMATMTKDIRTAARPDPDESPFLTADSTEILFHANLNQFAAPVLVRIYVDGNDRIVEEITQPDDTTPPYEYSGSPEVRVVGRYITNSNVFTYFDSNGDELSVPMEGDDEELRAINSVEVRMRIRKTTDEFMAPTTLLNRVRLPNVDYQPIGETG
jgi:prepilin-type N-terminal cleavage/methylation domain-containing protein